MIPVELVFSPAQDKPLVAIVRVAPAAADTVPVHVIAAVNVRVATAVALILAQDMSAVGVLNVHDTPILTVEPEVAMVKLPVVSVSVLVL